MKLTIVVLGSGSQKWGQSYDCELYNADPLRKQNYFLLWKKHDLALHNDGVVFVNALYWVQVFLLIVLYVFIAIDCLYQKTNWLW
jgi:hypothetical protein